MALTGNCSLGRGLLYSENKFEQIFRDLRTLLTQTDRNDQTVQYNIALAL
jgi:hypothetical protein